MRFSDLQENEPSQGSGGVEAMEEMDCVSGQPPASWYERQSEAAMPGKCSQLDAGRN